MLHLEGRYKLLRGQWSWELSCPLLLQHISFGVKSATWITCCFSLLTFPPCHRTVFWITLAGSFFSLQFLDVMYWKAHASIICDHTQTWCWPTCCVSMIHTCISLTLLPWTPYFFTLQNFSLWVFPKHYKLYIFIIRWWYLPINLILHFLRTLYKYLLRCLILKQRISLYSSVFQPSNTLIFCICRILQRNRIIFMYIKTLIYKK